MERYISLITMAGPGPIRGLPKVRGWFRESEFHTGPAEIKVYSGDGFRDRHMEIGLSVKLKPGKKFETDRLAYEITQIIDKAIPVGIKWTLQYQSTRKRLVRELLLMIRVELLQLDSDSAMLAAMRHSVAIFRALGVLTCTPVISQVTQMLYQGPYADVWLDSGYVLYLKVREDKP